MTLPEFVFTESLIKHKSKSDVYTITAEQRKGATSVFDMLNTLPGVNYDNLTSKVSVRNDERILLWVNNQAQNLDYIKAINPQNIKEIEIIHQLPGRYVTAGYKYIIDIKLKNDYAGNDLSVSNFTMFSPGNNGSDDIANEQPKLQYSHTEKKWSFNAGYGYGDIRWNYPISYEKTYIGVSSLASQEYSTDNPNDHNKSISHAANMGFDWRISDVQTLSLRTQYSHNKNLHTSFYNYTATQEEGNPYEISEETDDNVKNDDFKSSIIYNATFGNKWVLYADFSYNFYKANNENRFSMNGNEYNSNVYSIQKKNYYKTTADLIYNITNSASLNFGYSGTWNLYRFRQTNSSNLSGTKSNENRQNLFSYLDYAFNPQLSGRAGLALESVHVSDATSSHTYNKLLPAVSLNYIASQNLQIFADYSSEMAYPKLSQLSPISYNLDERMLAVGNANLKPYVKNELNLQAVLWQSLIFAGLYQFSNDYIYDYYSLEESIYKRSFLNAKQSALAFLVMYDWKISKNLTWRNSFQVSHERASVNGEANHANNIKVNSRLSYYFTPCKMWVQMSYYRNMSKVPLLQGYEQNGQDIWQLSLRRNFFRDQINVSLDYVPPIQLGVRETQNRMIETSFFKENQRLNLGTYDNMILLRVSFRLHNGKHFRINDKSKFDDERSKDRGLL